MAAHPHRGNGPQGGGFSQEQSGGLKLPTFFLAGAPKAGTTSLYHYLDQHPEIYMSPMKEPHFFSSEIREQNFGPRLKRMVARHEAELRQFLDGPMREKRFGGIVSEWDDYLRLFANASGEPQLGEASVCYLWSPSAPIRIAQQIPQAKILVMLRDPADREFSEYRQCLGSGVVRCSFRDYIRRGLKHRSQPFSIYHPSLELGLYGEQIRRYLGLFRENVWVGFHDDFRRRPREVYRAICRFLGVSADFAPNMRRRYLQGTAAAEPMEARDRRYLIDFYREDIALLATLLKSDLDAWLK
ncbi:MAG TPA: sulfotransferase [Capsulimonadaceae bacterium]|nr:sulfotransferase [Capsulimonadaceae bacterium]